MFSAPDQSCFDILRQRGWFAARSVPFQTDALKHSVQKDFQPGQPLYRYGDVGTGLFGVMEGSVQITIPADDGQEFVAHREEAGFWIGDLASLAEQTRLVTVVATAPTRTMFLSSARIEMMLVAVPEYWRDFYALSHENTQTALRILANLAVVKADRRLALRLLHLQETVAQAGGWIDVSQDALAAMVAVSVPTLQRALYRFVDAGLIELGYAKLRVLDRVILLEHGQT